MKKILLALLALITMVSCGDIEPIDPGLNPALGGPQGGATGTFRAKIDGRDFVATVAQSSITANNFIALGSVGQEQIVLTLAASTSGTYPFSLASSIPDAGGIYTPANNGSRNPYVAIDAADTTIGTGTMTVTFNANRTQVTGTFNMVAKRQVQDANGTFLFDMNNNPIVEEVAITEGSFNLPVVEDGSAPSGNMGTLTIANVMRNVDTLRASLFPATASFPESIAIVFQSDDDNLALTLESSITPGAYDILSANLDISSILNEDVANGMPAISFVEDSGTVNITAHDPVARTISGSFNILYEGFLAPGNTTASGTFSVSY